MSASPPVASAHPASPPLAGIACGVGAGALWGLVFLAPELVPASSALELTVGRYLAYGLISLVLIAPRWRMVKRHLTRREWITLVWLALSGNTFYYLMLTNAVQLGGIAMTSLVIGFLPVAVTIIGSRDHGAVALRRLIPSLLFCTAGAACIGWQAIMHPASGAVGAQLSGLLCAIGALALWSCYAVSNSRALARLTHISVHEWSLLTGLVTGAQTVLLLPFAYGMSSGAHSGGDWAMLAMVSAGLALLASIGGNALWNRASRLLPLTLIGQMVLFETLFALAYGFLWERRLPAIGEAAAFLLVVMSVVSCLHAHRRPLRAYKDIV